MRSLHETESRLENRISLRWRAGVKYRWSRGSEARRDASGLALFGLDARQQLPREAFRSIAFGDPISDLVPRNSFFADGVNNVDLALSKVFRMPWSGHSLSVRVEAFNVFNIVQFGFPVSDLTSPNFGSIVGTSNAYSPRVVQLVLRYRY